MTLRSNRPKPPPKSKAAPRLASRQTLAGAALIAALTTLIYLPSLGGDFVLDDDLLLTANPLIHAADGPFRFFFTTQGIDYYPVSNTVLWVEWRLWGVHPTGYHVTSLMLHLATVFLLWRLLLRLAVPGAFFAALLFAIHPINVESVAWIAQRKGLLALLFALLSVLTYVRADNGTPESPKAAPARVQLWYWASLLAFVLAVLSKGSLAILPAILLGMVCWNRRPTGADVIRLSPFFIVGAALVLVSVWFQAHVGETGFRTAGILERTLTAAALIWFYLFKALLPINLVFIYPQWHVDVADLRWWLPLLAAAALSAVLWKYRRTWARAPLFAWGFFCVALLPVLGFTDVGFMKHSLVANHYEHVALLAVVALLAAAWARLAETATPSWLAKVAAGAAVLILTTLAWHVSSTFASPISLYADSVEKNPDAWIVRTNFGVALSAAGRFQEAVEQHTHAVQLRPDLIKSHLNLAGALVEAGRLQEAADQYEEALRLEPQNAQAHANLGGVLARLGQRQQAVEHYQEALRLRPDHADTLYNLGLAFVEEGKLDVAIEHFAGALRARPEFADAEYQLGMALAQLQRWREAIEHFTRAVQLKPNYPEAHTNLGTALAQSGQIDAAITHYEQALRLQPDYGDARHNLEVVRGMKRPIK